MPSVFEHLGMLPCMQKVSIPVRHAAHLSREHQFSGGCKGKQACKKSHYRHLQIVFPPVRVQNLHLNPVASLAACVSKPGTSRQPPGTAKLLCWSLAHVWHRPGTAFPGRGYRSQVTPEGPFDMIPVLRTQEKFRCKDM